MPDLVVTQHPDGEHLARGADGWEYRVYLQDGRGSVADALREARSGAETVWLDREHRDAAAAALAVLDLPADDRRELAEWIGKGSYMMGGRKVTIEIVASGRGRLRGRWIGGCAVMPEVPAGWEASAAAREIADGLAAGVRLPFAGRADRAAWISIATAEGHERAAAVMRELGYLA